MSKHNGLEISSGISTESDKNDTDKHYPDDGIDKHYPDVNHSDAYHLPDNKTDVCEQLLNHKDQYKMSAATELEDSSSSSIKSDAHMPFLCNGDMLSDDSDDCVEVDVIRKMSRDHPESHDSSFSSNDCEKVHNIEERVSDQRTSTDEGDDTVASRMDLEKISSIKSRTSNKQAHPRKESFEQRLRRTFTIKDAHTSEVTRRVVAVVIKYSLFIFNFVSWITAVIAIGLGIWMRTDKTLLVTSDTEFYLDLPLLTCIGGGVTFIVAFLGCVGALRENLILLRVFFYVLAIILVGEMILAIIVFVIYTVPEARDNFLRSQPERILYSAIERYMDDTEVKAWVDRIQSEFKCCGISHTDEGFRDWQISPYFNCTSSNRSIYRCAVPTSCCIFKQGDRVNIMCGFETTDKTLNEVRDYIYTRGCIVGFGEWLGKYNDFIIISCLSVIVMQFLAVLSAKVMVVRIRKQRSRWRVLQNSSSSSANTVSRSV